jgi:hypothetical protein
MRKMLFALFLLLPAPVFAGPPEGVSGNMVLSDPVMDALRQYRRETNSSRRINWLIKWAPDKDPRVAVALGEASVSDDPDVSQQAMRLVCVYYELLDSEDTGGLSIRGLFFRWWKKNEGDLRRRAKQLPK